MTDSSSNQDRDDQDLSWLDSPQPKILRYARPSERQEVAMRIDPDTASVFFDYANILDPYGEECLSEEEKCVGRIFFALDPEERVAVCFCDLPESTRHALDHKRDQADRDGWALIQRLLQNDPK